MHLTLSNTLYITVRDDGGAILSRFTGICFFNQGLLIWFTIPLLAPISTSWSVPLSISMLNLQPLRELKRILRKASRCLLVLFLDVIQLLGQLWLISLSWRNFVTSTVEWNAWVSTRQNEVSRELVRRVDGAQSSQVLVDTEASQRQSCLVLWS